MEFSYEDRSLVCKETGEDQYRSAPPPAIEIVNAAILTPKLC